MKEKIKQRRLELGLTLDEVAKIVGVSGATISRWESGDIENMRRDKIALLAKALNTTPAFLMGWDLSQSEMLNTFLSKHEKEVIDAYRRSPDIRFAVDRILNVRPLDE